MSQSTKTYIIISAIVGIVLGLFLLPKARIIFSSQKPDKSPQIELLDTIVSNNDIQAVRISISDPLSNLSINSTNLADPSTAANTVKDYLEVVQKSSEKEKAEFEKTAMIKMNLPSDVIFSKQDSDDGMISMVGRKQNSNQIYGVFARKGLSTSEEVEKFLPELAQRIPGVPEDLVNSKVTAEPYEISPDSLFKNVYTWQIQTDKSVFYMIKADRKDNIGSYMLFTTGNKKDTERTEKDFENIINSIQASPAGN